MRKTLSGIAIALLMLAPGSARGAWDRVLNYSKAGVEVVERSEDRLVLRHTKSNRTLVLSVGDHPDSHIVGELKRRRGGNPYRVWLATSRLTDSPHLPRSSWGLFFRSEFLRLIRTPRASNIAR